MDEDRSCIRGLPSEQIRVGWGKLYAKQTSDAIKKKLKINNLKRGNRVRVLAKKTVVITRLSHDGRGVARDQNKVLFVHGALPGEKVEVVLTKQHRQYDDARCEQVLEASASRVTPLCQYFGNCGGCQLQHLEPVKQIEYKQALLEEQLQQLNVVPQTWLVPLTHSFFGYRQKARLGVRYVDKKAAVLVGFREQSSNKITMMNDCAILDPRVGNAIEALKALFLSLKGMRDIPQIEVAIGGDEVALVFRHLAPLIEEDVQKITEFSRQKNFTVYLQPGAPETVHQIWPDPKRNTLEYKLRDQALRFEFHPLDFTQVNAELNQAMINQALDILSPQKHHKVLDLFCGLGNFSLPLAQRAEKVVGVEGAMGMVQRAKKNALLNGIENAEFHAADLDSDWRNQSWAKEDYDSVLLDPPRSGALAIVQNIEKLNANAILYVSCNPATFVRDAAILVHEKGYTLSKCGVMDMFPQTAHVETMGLFTKER